MAVPPQFRKAAKRRLDAALPSNKSSNTKKGGVATFAKPGNKAGQGLMQQVETPQENNQEVSSFLSQLGNAPSKKPKTKVQPAANRKLMAMRMAAKK